MILQSSDRLFSSKVLTMQSFLLKLTEYAAILSKF